MEPLWKGQGSLTKVAKFCPFPCTILYKSCLFYPLWQATSFERPRSWVAFIHVYRGVPLYIILWKICTGTGNACTLLQLTDMCLWTQDSNFRSHAHMLRYQLSVATLVHWWVAALCSWPFGNTNAQYLWGKGFPFALRIGGHTPTLNQNTHLIDVSHGYWHPAAHDLGPFSFYNFFFIIETQRKICFAKITSHPMSPDLSKF